MANGFVGFVMTYDRPAILCSTIEKVLTQTSAPEHLLVIDNGNNPETAEVVRRFPSDLVRYHRMGYNSGPAGAAAFGLRELARLGADWIWWGDDDDPPRFPDTFARLLSLRTTTESSGGVGAVSAVGAKWDWKLGRPRRLSDSELDGVVEIDIMPGGIHPIISRRVIDEVGVPRPELFFSLEDIEYSLRIRRAGFSIVTDGELFLRHRAAANRLNLTKRRRLLSQRQYHEIWRQYYSSRNYIHFMRREFGRKDLARREACKCIARSATSWLRGVRYGAAFTQLQMQAVYDGYAGRMGLTVLPQAKYASK